MPLHASRASVEASWKYILIGSVGIALAFAGTVLAYFDFVTVAGRQSALNWTVLLAPRPAPRRGAAARVRVHPDRLRHQGRAGADAHLAARRAFEAPAALSAMMSGVLLAVAVYAVVRWQAVVRAAVGPASRRT